ncbi:MAG: AAA family ATPase, partial [Planctomycetales bacterium]|nr:AAA family ATPase [Planctomycetales bacterium]
MNSAVSQSDLESADHDPRRHAALPVEFREALAAALGHDFVTTLVLNKTANHFTLLGRAAGDLANRVVKAYSLSGMPAGTRLRLERDLPVLKRIECDHLAELIDCPTAGDWRFTVFKRVEGCNLGEIVAARPLDVPQALDLAGSVLAGLSKLHAHNMLHGNVCLSNVRVPSEGFVRAVLVGLGPSASTLTGTSDDRHALGLAEYLPPELAGTIEHDAGPWSDLYSLGVLLYAAVTGAPPFQGADMGQVLYDHLTAPVPALSSRGLVGAPRAFEDLLLHLLQKDPSARYQTADAALADVRELARRLRHGDEDPQIAIGVSDRKTSLSEPSYVGREQELKLVRECLSDVQRGDGGVMLVEAVSGGGKSRFLTEAAQLARREDAWVLRGQETNDVGRRLLQVLDGVVTGILARAATRSGFDRKLRDALGDDRGALVEMLPRLEPLIGKSTGSKAPDQFGEARALRALTALLDALASDDQPVLILLDDCQWADELSLKMIQHWSSRQQSLSGRNRLLLLAAFRSEEVGDEHLLRRVDPRGHVRLPGLTDRELRQLAESMAGTLPEDVLDVVVRLADGSPFMGTAVLRGLFECGTLRPGEQGWVVDREALKDCQSSDAAATLLTRRVDSMGSDAIELLSIGAVLGKEFDIELAANLASVTTVELIESIDEAREKRLTWLRPDGTSCVFVHDKIRSAVLAHLSTQRAQDIHQRAAQLLLRGPGANDADIAYHFDAAGDPKSALPYALLAARGARSKYALEVARQQYMIAERGATPDDRTTRFHIYEGLGEIGLLQGRYDEAGRWLGMASKLAEGSLARAEIRGKLAELSLKRGDMEQAVCEYEAALRGLGVYVPSNIVLFTLMLAVQAVAQVLHTVAPRLFLHRRRRLPDKQERLQLHLLQGLSHACFYARSRIVMFWAHQLQMNTAELYLPSEELAEAYASHGIGVSLYSLYDRAEAYCRRSLEIRETLGNVWGQGQSLHYWGIALYTASRFHECVAKCRESVRLLERTGDYQQVHTARYQLAASLYHLGDFAQAIEEARRNHRSGLLTGDTQASAINLEVWARADLEAIPIEAIEAERQRERSDPQGAAQVALAYALWLLGQNREAEAIALLRGAVQNTHDRGIKNQYTLSLMAWIAVALRQSAERLSPYALRERRRTLREAARAATQAVRASWMCKNDVPMALREGALANALLGKTDKAKRQLLRSLALAKKQRARYEFAQSLIAYGEIGASLGWRDAERRRKTGTRVKEQLELKRRERSRGARRDEQNASLSLIDRFDTVVESGRQIASALKEDAIYEQTRAAALRLLRGQQSVIWEIRGEETQRTYHPLAGDARREADSRVVQQYLEIVGNGAATPLDISAQVAVDGAQGSCLAAPVFVRGALRALLVVSHDELSGLFGSDELRLAEFVATIAGAALENAAGFRELQELNLTLESRVAERTAAAESKARELAESYEELKRVADELKSKEEQLQIAKRAAESASNAKSQFLATMSHEIRTPLNGILGMAELALRSPLTPQIQSYVETVRQSGEALLILLNDVLDLSKIEAGKMEL